MLFHPFVLAGDLTARLSLELLQKVRNPEEAASAAGGSAGIAGHSAFDAEPDDEGIVANVPRRISSRAPKNKQKSQSEINSEFLHIMKAFCFLARASPRVKLNFVFLPRSPF